jgi:hypothetical protein
VRAIIGVQRMEHSIAGGEKDVVKAFVLECAALGQAYGNIDEDVKTPDWFGCQAASSVPPAWWFQDGQPGG